MLTVDKTIGNSIQYHCSCGIKGVLMIKPLEEKLPVVIDIQCVNCEESRRLTLLRDGLKNSTMNDIDFSWAIIISNELIG